MTMKSVLRQGPTMRTVKKGRPFDLARIDFQDTSTRERFDALQRAFDARRTMLRAAHRRYNRRVGLPLNPSLVPLRRAS